MMMSNKKHFLLRRNYLWTGFVVVCLLLSQNAFPKKQLSKKEAFLKKEKEVYLSYKTKKKEVKRIFKSKPIQRKLYLSINVPSYVFPPLFSDLRLAVKKSVQYAKTKYTIQYNSNKNAYNGFDGIKTYATIYPMFQKANGSHYVYYAKGTFKTFVDLKGEMIIDIKLKRRPGNKTDVVVKVYLRISNLLVSRFAKTMMRTERFSDYLDQLVDRSIKRIQKVGYKIGYGVYKEHLNKKNKK